MAKDNTILYLGAGLLALLYLRKQTAAAASAPVIVADVPPVAVVHGMPQTAMVYNEPSPSYYQRVPQFYGPPVRVLAE